MAGIGFELKRLFSKRTLTSKLVGVFHSVFSTVGHLLISITLLLAVHLMLINISFDDFYKEIYSSAVLYAFAFSFLFTNGSNILLSRYIADNIYLENYEKILPSVFGSVLTYIILAAPAGIIFYIFSPLNAAFKIGAYLLFIEMGIIFKLMVYVSALNNYKVISLSFFLGFLVTGVLSYFIIQMKDHPMNTITLLIYAFDFGASITMTGILFSIKGYFSKRSNNYFDFLLYLKKYPALFCSSLIYGFGLYIHNFVFWIYPETRDSVASFIFSTKYDMASFIGMITIIPATVFFVVRVETSFYDNYKAYLEAINEGTVDQIEKTKKEMQNTLWRELFFIIEVQIAASLFFIVIGMGILPGVGMSNEIVEMYPFLSCGYFFTFLMFITNTILLYFQSYNDVLMINILFFFSNLIFTVLTALMGSDFYGLGLIGSGIISFTASFNKLKKTMDNIDYVLFCSQSLREQNRITFFERFIAKLDGKKVD